MRSTHLDFQTTNRSSLGLICFTVALIAGLALGLHGTIVQPAQYHAFADQRAAFGIPHFMDVLSNLPFLFVGVWGLLITKQATHLPSQRAWQAFFAAVCCTSFASSYYHWAPDDFGLFIDRLPIAWACAWLSCAVLAERVHQRFAERPVLIAVFIAATLATTYWFITQMLTQTQGDLRPYLFIQFLPMLLVPLCAWFTRHENISALKAISGTNWAIVLGLYAAAKLFELADHAVLEAVGMVSGHTIKHLLAAAAAFWLANSLFIAYSPKAPEVR